MGKIDKAKASLREFQARHDDCRIESWQLSLTDSNTLSVGVKDREIGGVYKPPSIRRVIAGSIYVVWHDGQISKSTVNNLFLRDFEERVKGLRRSAYKETFVIDMPEDRLPPEVKVYDENIDAILSNGSASFEILARYGEKLDAAQNSFDGGVGARTGTLTVVNSRGLDRQIHSSVHSFGVSADSLFGIGYQSRRVLGDEQIDTRLNFLNDWLPKFHNRGEEDLPSGERVAVLLPSAASSFLGHFVLHNLNGEAVANKNSAWSPADFDQKRGVFHDSLTVSYDPTVDWLSRSYRMDSRGLMAESACYIADGRLVRPIVTLKAARQLSCMPSPIPSSSGLTLQGSSHEKMTDFIKGLDDAIVVPSVLGMHTQDNVRGNYSLSVPSALVVKNGEITGCRKVTIAGNFFDDLGRELTTLDNALDDMSGLALRTKVDFA